MRIGDDERSTCFMTCFVSLPSEQFNVKHISGSSEDNVHTTNDLGDLVVDVGHSIIYSMRRPQIFRNDHPSFLLYQLV
jgi:hypothetical protein